MANTPAAIGRRYLPFIALAAVQVLLVAVVPSRGPAKASNVATGEPGATSTAAGPGGATDTAGGGAGAAFGGASGSLSGAGGSGSAAGGSTATGAAGTTGGVANGPADMSHCDKNGKQIGPPNYYYMPPCAPVWHGGDNGGSTMTGVFPDHINYVIYKAQGDAQVNAILAEQGLAASNEQACEAYQAFHNEINKRWELYGRKFVSLDGSGANKGSTNQDPCHFPYFQGQCQLTPPQPDCARAEAKVIAAMKPAFVLAGVADSALYDELAKQHIIVLGGGGGPIEYYQQAEPYLYGLLMDGGRQAAFLGEYWCKKLNAKPAVFAGDDVKTARNWGPAPGVIPTRKLAVVFPETNGDEAVRLSVNRFKALVTGKECNTPGGVLAISYESDINTAQQQAVSITQQLIDNHITTVLCYCDPIAPVFATQNMAKQGYFPEHWLGGVFLMDYDLFGRLYDQSEWIHAFGVSDLALAQKFEESDAANWWHDAGNQGLPDKTENAVVPFFSMMATAFQIAGPQPTPVKIRAQLTALPVAGGWKATHDPHSILVGFKPPSLYTAAMDTREVYWNPSRPSESDGQAGSYCPVNKGERYDLGEWTTGDPDVFDQQKNGC